MMLGGRFKPSQTKGSKELAMDLNIIEPGMTTTTFAERGRVGTDFFHNIKNEGTDDLSRRSSNLDYSQPPSAMLHTEEILNEDYRPSRLANSLGRRQNQINLNNLQSLNLREKLLQRLSNFTEQAKYTKQKAHINSDTGLSSDYDR